MKMEQRYAGRYGRVHEMIRFIRLAEESDGNVVQRLGIEALSESAAEDISTVTGLDAEEVLLVIECLRHYGPVSRLAEKGRAAGTH